MSAQTPQAPGPAVVAGKAKVRGTGFVVRAADKLKAQQGNKPEGGR